ncbi:hypothetical protein H0I23_11040 [Cellulophaga sp. HaHaR_3_176]|uniref:hypothetical protein n=1 Tax=Cellulophaga sp. HaHaR_3_176 TaxID=1942464 RepID=UPI001C1F6F57|nr:hypothetical protein [Cellulophaga sp. HaHaR_3_176]QWX82995.1 hypothetical protein H0I23_11040 [Cellulophaga sp. HaHaR_3_176]
MIKKHSLLNKELNKIFNIELVGLKVVYESGKIDKPRTYEKEFKSDEEALKFFYKKEWEMLKKGFVLNNPEATFGNAKLHYFTSSGYSGCLSFANTPNDIFVYEQGSYDDPKDQYDFLINIDKSGNLKSKIKLPDILPWDIQYNSSNNSLLIKLDHHIYTFNINDQSFHKIADREKGNWASFISIAKKAYAYGTNEQLTVKDFDNTILFNQNYKVEIIKGSNCFSATLSKTKNIIALHNKLGEVELFDFKTNNYLKTIKGDFKGIDKMEFVASDSILILKQHYHQPLLYINVEKNEQVYYPSLEIPEYFKGVVDFCLNKEASKLVLSQGNKAHVYDMENKKHLHSFKIEHSVKTANIKFIDNDLGVRTDYGCFSLYTV